MEKRVKKLVLAKETVRGLDLERVVGASDEQNSCFSTYYSACPYICDMPETTYTFCIG